MLRNVLPLLLLMTHNVAVAAELETVAVVGTHLTGGERQHSGQLSIIDREMIDALNKNSLQQLFNGLAGVSINRSGGAGGATSLYIRGGEANFAVVMIDGVQVNDPSNTRGGSFNFATIDINAIERIELIRGPQSAVYGADALSGVINLITRTGEGTSATLRAELGSDNFYRGSGRFSLDFNGGGELTVAAGHTDSGDVVSASEHTISYVHGRLNYPLADALQLVAAWHYSESERLGFPEDSGGPDHAIWQQRDQADSDDLSLRLALQHDIQQHWQMEWAAQYYHSDAQQTSPGIYPGFAVPPNGAHTRFERLSVAWINRLEVATARFSFGLDGEREDGRSEGYLDFGFPLATNYSLERDNLAAFAEVQWRLGEQVTLSAALRHDRPEHFASETTAKVGLSYRAGTTRLSANWGEGIIIPSFLALAHPLVGNPELKPERAVSWDIGIEQLLASGLNFKLVYFDNHFEDLVDFDDATFRNVNRDDVSSTGVELTLGFASQNWGRVQAHATYNDVEIRHADEQLRGRPRWKAGAQWFYRHSGTLDLSLEYLWVDRVVESSHHGGQPLDYTLDAYNTVDFSLNWQMSPALRWELAVSNILDQSYEQAVGFPASGFFPRLGVQFTF